MKLNYQVYNTKRNTYYAFAIPAGGVLMLWEISLYRTTIIELYIPLLIMFGVGLIAAMLDFKNYQKTYSYRGVASFFFAYLSNLCIWGFAACTLFMVANHYLADTSNGTLNQYAIINSGTMSAGSSTSSMGQPYFYIDYNGTEKQLIFSKEYASEQEKYEFVEIETAKGFFGFDIVLGTELIEYVSFEEPDNNNVENVMFEWAVHDKDRQTVVANSRAIVSSFSATDTIYHDSDSLVFMINYDDEYCVEFTASGYQSKTILVDTRGIPEKEKQYGYIMAGMIVDLIPMKDAFINDTVATCAYDPELKNFKFNLLKK